MLLLILSSLTVLGLWIYLERWYRKPYIDGFRSKAVFITGTDSGFGFMLAVNLVKLGVKVYAGCYTQEGAESLRKATDDGIKVVNIDISDRKSVSGAKEIIEEDLKQTGRELWGLVNNAGVFRGATFCLSTHEDYTQTMEVNFFGTLNVTEAFMPLIKKSSGRIVNVSAMAARTFSFIEPYACSKAALTPYNAGLRRWMRRYKVHVALIEPGMYNFTNIVKNAMLEANKDPENIPQNLSEEYGEKVLNKLKEDFLTFARNPLFARWNRPQDVPNNIKHALFAKHPKDSYLCGLDARFLYRFFIFYPDFLLDFVLRQYFRSYTTGLENIHLKAN